MYFIFPFFQAIVSIGISPPYHLCEYIPFYGYRLVRTYLLTAHTADALFIIDTAKTLLDSDAIHGATDLTEIAARADTGVEIRLEIHKFSKPFRQWLWYEFERKD